VVNISNRIAANKAHSHLRRRLDGRLIGSGIWLLRRQNNHATLKAQIQPI
jgi:hypothetical protein